MLTGRGQAARSDLAPVGVVLCGGQSTRMGKDKGLLKEGTQTWAQMAAQKLAVFQQPVAVSVNRRQLPAYSTLFSKEQLVPDNDDVAVKGPLLGLLSVHLKFPGNDLLVLACDMKDMSTAVLQNVHHHATQSNHEAFVCATDGKPQPLFGIYTANGLKRLYSLLGAGELKRFSMRHVLAVLNTAYLAVQNEDLPCFNNYNSPDDL